MLLHYTGSRPFTCHDFRHKRFIFDKKNYFVCDVIDKEGAGMLIETGEYMPVTEDDVREIKEKAKKRDDFLSGNKEEKIEKPKEIKVIEEPKEEETEEIKSVEEPKKKKKSKSKKSAK